MLKFIYSFISLLVFTTMLFLALILIDLNWAQRPSRFTIYLVEKLLTTHSHEVKINKISLALNKELYGFNLTLYNTTNKRLDNNNIAAYFPLISIDIPFKSMIPMMGAHKKITINNPEINMISLNEENVRLIKFSNVDVEIINAKVNFWQKDSVSSSLLFNGEFLLNSQQIILKHLLFTGENNSYLKLCGQIDQKVLDLKITAENFLMNNINLFWPQWLKNDWRELIFSKISEGIVHKASGTFHYEFQDMAKNIVDGVVEVMGVKLHYYQTLPDISQINATLFFDNNKISVDVTEAIILNSKISKTNVIIPFSLDYLDVNGNVEGDIADLLSFIPDRQLLHLKQYNIENENIEGKSVTQIKKLTIPLKLDVKADEINYDITAHCHMCAIKNLINKNIQLDHGDLVFYFNGEILHIEGLASLNNRDSKITFDGYVAENSTNDFELNIKSSLLPTHHIFDVLENKISDKGQMIYDLTIQYANNLYHLNIDAELKDLEIMIDDLGLHKKMNQELNLRAVVTMNDKVMQVQNFNLLGDNIDIKGNARFQLHDLSLKEMRLNPIIFQKNNFCIQYSLNNEKNEINISGSHVDLSHANVIKLIQSSDYHDSLIKLNIDTISMPNDVMFSSVNSLFSCTKIKGCNSGSLTANLNKNFKFKFLLIPDTQDQSKIKITSDNASLIAKGFDIYKNTNKGHLEINAIKKSNAIDKVSTINGSVKMSNFEASKISIFNKIISLTSVPGLMRLLLDDHLTFNSMELDFDIIPHKITIKNGKIEGNQMAMTMGGNIDTQNKLLDLHGFLIPDLFTLNKIFSSIPLLGHVLKGSNKEGVITLDYNIKGPFNNPYTFANPFTITPGLIKYFFQPKK